MYKSVMYVPGGPVVVVVVVVVTVGAAGGVQGSGAETRRIKINRTWQTTVNEHLQKPTSEYVRCHGEHEERAENNRGKQEVDGSYSHQA